jgi:NTP pyrophosphatase (non-canonical NTP hydrolase)
MSDHTKLEEPNLWIPEQNQVHLALLGKLAEEANELGGRAARCIIQGLDGIDPEDGRLNREHLADEIADVRALCDLASNMFFPEKAQHIHERKLAKYDHKQRWFDKLARWVMERVQ